MGVFANVQSVSPDLYPSAQKFQSNGREISRLITAAVVNQGFCNMLLANPASALASGYNGEAFCLETEVQDLIVSIRANSLSEFAMQLVNVKNGNGKHHYKRVGKTA